MTETKRHQNSSDSRRQGKGPVVVLLAVLALAVVISLGHFWFFGKGTAASASSPVEVNQMLTEIAANSAREGGNYEVDDLTEQFESDTTSSVQTLTGDDVTVQVYAYKGTEESDENFSFFYETLALSAPEGEKKTERNDLLILESETDYIVLAKQEAQVIYAQGRAAKKSEVDSILHEMGVRY